MKELQAGVSGLVWPQSSADFGFNIAFLHLNKTPAPSTQSETSLRLDTPTVARKFGLVMLRYPT